MDSGGWKTKRWLLAHFKFLRLAEICWIKTPLSKTQGAETTGKDGAYALWDER